METTIGEKIAAEKAEIVSQLVQCIKKHDIHDENIDGFEDFWYNSFELEKELDQIVIRLAKITNLLTEIEKYED